MRVGLLPGSLSGSGGPGTYVTGFAKALTQLRSTADVRVLLLGTKQATRAAARQRATASALLGVAVRGRPVSTRLLQRGRSALLPSYDRLFGRHELYHQTHLDLDPPVPDSKLVLTLHDVIADHWPDEGRLLPGAERLLSRAAAVITVSATSRETILSRFPGVSRSRVHVVWNGVDHGAFQPVAESEDEQRLESFGLRGPYLLYVGGLTRRKNVALLVEAYRSLHAQEADMPSLVLVGPWSPNRLDAQAAVSEGVLALGMVPADAVPALMRRATALLLPSREEGFGLPLLEAQACGTPVLCSDIAVFREIGGGAPLYVDTSSCSALAEGVRRLLAVPAEELARRRETGLRHASGFSWQRSAEGHLRVYQAVMAAGSA
ncbi:MAG: glycosyltransferase family 4 protein [Actinobacteria bacterium]|nr:glycosyltransferase family 4 protein [Actinomycetota bacterium]